MSASAAARAGGHESHYDPPSGWLFGVRPGEKYEKEGWERIWFWGMYGSLGLATVAYVYKPDTRYVLAVGGFCLVVGVVGGGACGGFGGVEDV